ncbi:MAG: hypothetical protein KME49_01410 [Brasilonema octagenarum HA4186-MV1]|nr:hypothetical protein [Brasilonema octagenarum HA4186-MV1]
MEKLALKPSYETKSAFCRLFIPQKADFYQNYSELWGDFTYDEREHAKSVNLFYFVVRASSPLRSQTREQDAPY